MSFYQETKKSFWKKNQVFLSSRSLSEEPKSFDEETVFQKRKIIVFQFNENLKSLSEKIWCLSNWMNVFHEKKIRRNPVFHNHHHHNCYSGCKSFIIVKKVFLKLKKSFRNTSSLSVESLQWIWSLSSLFIVHEKWRFFTNWWRVKKCLPWSFLIFLSFMLTTSFLEQVLNHQVFQKKTTEKVWKWF